MGDKFFHILGKHLVPNFIASIIFMVVGTFLVTLLMCLTNIGNYLRKAANRKESNL